MDIPSFDHIAVKVTAIAGRYWYGTLDANALRKFVDSTFPDFAKDSVADKLRGQGHRWVYGHDLLTDALPKLLSNPEGAIHRAGHILLTDFPTKAGIPIPGFSANGLGQILADWGIHKGYMCLNIADGTVGIMAVSESHADLLTALNGGTIDGWTFFDTYGEGISELIVGYSTKNPLLIAAGFENIAAGVVTTCDELIVTLDEFFGAALGGALIGLGISLLLWRNRSAADRIRKVLFTGTRAAILGGVGAISPFLSLGLAAGFCLHELCKSIIEGKAKVHEYEPGVYRVALASCMESPIFREAWEAYSAYQLSIAQLTEKQETSIQRSLSVSMEDLNTLIISTAHETSDTLLPEDVSITVVDGITNMLNQQHKSIIRLIDN